MVYVTRADSSTSKIFSSKTSTDVWKKLKMHKLKNDKQINNCLDVKLQSPDH